MFETINIQKVTSTAENWFMDTLWTTDTLIQSIVWGVSIIFASIVYGFVRPKLKALLEEFKLPATVKRMMNNLIRLCLPLFTLIFMFIGVQILMLESIDVGTKITMGLMKVLVAWIVIRIAVQFIANSLVRNIFALAIWTIAVLSIFGVLEQTHDALDALAFSVGNFRISALVVIKGLLLLFGLLYFALFISSFAERRIFEIKSLTRSSQVLIAKVLRVTLIVVALLIGITASGIDLSLFAVFGGAIGLGIGFGLQKGVSNLFSGMLLLIDRSIKPGDVIEIPDIGTFGWVNNMAARYTEIVTRDNKSFLIPNEDFITQRVINWSHGNSLVRIHLEFGVHYNSDPHKVMEIAIEAAKAPERVVSVPEPVCWITEFADSSINFDLRFWIKDASEGVANIRGQVYLALWDAFKENGVEIPYPHREVYMHEVKS